jgi:hypothetical protein
MPKLTNTQLVILSTASQRDDGSVLPLPKSVKLQGGAVHHVLKSLLKKGLLDEQRARHDATVWRESMDGQRFMLVITDDGRAATGVATDQAPKKQSAAAKTPPGKPRTRTRRRAADPKSKRKAQRPAARRLALEPSSPY